MNLEQEICRRVYDHHSVLKGRVSQTLLELSKKHNLSKEATVALMKALESEVDTTSDKMVNDYQKAIKAAK